MTGYLSALTELTEKKSFVHVELGDDATYAIQGVGSTSFQLDSSIVLHIEEILFVPRLKKNLLSISTLEDKGFRATFMDGKALLWPKDRDMILVVVIGVREGGLYTLPRRHIQALVHDTINLCELWHRRLAQFHYIALPRLKSMVTGMLDLHSKHMVFVEVVLLARMPRSLFPVVTNDLYRSWS
jgi:hypothetical protein